MKLIQRIGSVIAASILTAGIAIAATACGGNGGPTHFSIFIAQGESSEYYGLDYAQNPVVQYLESKTWNVDGKDVQLSFEWEVPNNGDTTSLAQAISGGTYTDVIDASTMTSIMSVRSAYEQGLALDLTEYVDQYMPNYKKLLEDNPTLAQTASTLMPDGTRKHLQIWAYQGNNERMWGGWLYRRDWIIKYGKNPSTNAAFTSEGWKSKTIAGRNDDYRDDVLFPSWYGLDAQGNTMTGPNGQDFKTWYLTVDPSWDGADPVTISDWEWMLNIFATAIQTENISGGFPMGMYYPGYYEPGDLACSFGVGPTWYLTENKTKANFGMTSDGFREYLKTMNIWYSNGWINQKFNENNKIFYEADMSDAAQGKVGLWWGQNAQMADQIEASGVEATKGAVVYGARQPINTTYGDDSLKFNIPEIMYQTGQEMRSFIITDAAEDKDIAAFCTMMDYMYTVDGAVMQAYGLPKDKYEEYKTATGKTNKWYEQFADENGEVIVNVEGDGWRYSNKVVADAQEDMLRGSRLWGYAPRWDMQCKSTYPVTTMRVVDQWVFYRMKGDVSNALLAQLDADKGDEFATLKTNLRSFGEQNVYKFVKGENDPNATTAWRVFCTRVNELKVQDGVTILQELLDKLNK